MPNEEIKEALYKTGLKQWELADLLGIHEITLCKKLRHELPGKEKKEILSLIKNNEKK